MVRVTADSNVYISALNFGGPPDKLLDLARAGEIHRSISDEIIEAVSRVLREKFRWAEDAVKLAVERIGDFTERVRPSEQVAAVEEDPADNRILECAVTSRSDYVVTGDKHLLKLGQFADARIAKPADFLETQLQRGHRR